MKKVPDLRFPEFEGEWKNNSFGDIFDLKITNSYTRSDLSYEDGEIKNIHYGDIHTKYPTIVNIDKGEVPYIKNSVNIKGIKADNYCVEGDIVIADASEDYADVGKTIEIMNISDNKVTAGLHTILGRDKEGQLINGFRGYLMNSPYIHKQVRVLATGVKVIGISKEMIRKVELLYPSKQEQQKIADFFSTLDSRIEIQEEKINNLEDQKKGYMQRIFSQEMRFKDENGENYPEWEEKRVEEVFELTRGIVIAKTTLKDTPNNLDIYPVYSSQTSNQGVLGYTNEYMFEGNFLTWTTDGANAGKVFARSGRFSCTNVCGLMIDKEGFKGYANNCIAELLNKETPKYVSYVGNPKLMNNVMAGVRITCPSVEEQQKIANFLSLFDEKIEIEKKILEALQEMKRGFLQKMFV